MADSASKARIRPLATTDLEGIVRYLDAQSITAGDKFLSQFVRSTDMLAQMPRLGSIRRKRGRLKGLRSWAVTASGPYLIFYLPLADGIDVLRVIHGARNIERLLRQGLQKSIKPCLAVDGFAVSSPVP